MKKVLFSLAMFSVLSMPVLAKEGLIYSDTVIPSRLANQAITSCKVGKAECQNYFGLVQLGDCSYDAAMKNGRISHVKYHDTQIKGWFFLKHKITRVYGD